MASFVKELVEVTKCSPKKGEEEQAFLRRLVTAANGVDDGEWKKVSMAAQKWTNAGVDAMEAKEDIKVPAGLADAMAGDEKAPAKKSAKAEPKKAAAKTSKKSAAKAGGAKAKKGKVAAKGGRPRLQDDAKVHWLTKELPAGMRNKYQKDVKEGTKVGDIRGTKALFKAVKFWRRKNMIELVGGA